jgi:hypothetical protein
LLSMLLFCSAFSSVLKKEAICSSEMLVNFQWTTSCYIPEDSTPTPYFTSLGWTAENERVHLQWNNTFKVLSGISPRSGSHKSLLTNLYLTCLTIFVWAALCIQDIRYSDFKSNIWYISFPFSVTIIYKTMDGGE